MPELLSSPMSNPSPLLLLMRVKALTFRHRTAGAKEDFKWVLDNQPAGVDLERVAEIYRSL